jgi:hypothetical protein
MRALAMFLAFVMVFGVGGFLAAREEGVYGDTIYTPLETDTTSFIYSGILFNHDFEHGNYPFTVIVDNALIVKTTYLLPVEYREMHFVGHDRIAAPGPTIYTPMSLGFNKTFYVTPGIQEVFKKYGTNKVSRELETEDGNYIRFRVNSHGVADGLTVASQGQYGGIHDSHYVGPDTTVYSDSISDYNSYFNKAQIVKDFFNFDLTSHGDSEYPLPILYKRDGEKEMLVDPNFDEFVEYHGGDKWGLLEYLQTSNQGVVAEYWGIEFQFERSSPEISVTQEDIVYGSLPNPDVYYELQETVYDYYQRNIYKSPLPNVSDLEWNTLGDKGGTVTVEYKQKDAQDTAYTTVTPSAIGRYTVRASVTGTDNWAPVSSTSDFSITKADPPVSTPSPRSATYGNTLSDVVLPAGWTWDASHPSLTSVGNAGTRTLNAVYTHNGDTTNYNQVKRAVTINVSKKTPDEKLDSEEKTKEVVYSPDAKLGNHKLSKGWSWTEGTGASIGNAGVRVHPVLYTPADTANYSTKPDSVTFTVVPATPKASPPDDQTAKAGDALGKIRLPKGWSWDEGDDADVGAPGVRSHNVTYTHDNTANYIKLKATVKVTVMENTPDPPDPGPPGPDPSPGDNQTGPDPSSGDNQTDSGPLPGDNPPGPGSSSDSGLPPDSLNNVNHPAYNEQGGGGYDDDKDGVPNINDPDAQGYYAPGGGGYDDDGDGVPNINDPDSPCYSLPGGGGFDDDQDGIPNVNDPDSPCYYLPGGGIYDDDRDGIPNINDPDSPCYSLPGGGGYDDDKDGIANINDPDSMNYILPGGGGYDNLPDGFDRDSNGDGIPDCNDPSSPAYMRKGAYLPPDGHYRPGGGGRDDDKDGIININDPDSPCYSLPGGLGYESKHIRAIRTPFKTLYLTKGGSLVLPLAYDGENGRSVERDPGVQFRSSKAKIVKISANGGIKALKSGKSVITVRASSGKTLKVKIVVSAKKKALTSLTVTSPKNLALNKKKGETWVMKPDGTAIIRPKISAGKSTNVSVSFVSSAPKVVKVDRAGKLWPQAKGKAVITVKAKQKGGKTKVFKKAVTVK